MRRIRWAPAAADDLEAVRNYLRKHHPSFMESTISQLYNAVRTLPQMPHRGRVGQKEGTRELVMTPLPYIIIYGVEPDLMHIFRILHAAKNRS